VPLLVVKQVVPAGFGAAFVALVRLRKSLSTHALAS